MLVGRQELLIRQLRQLLDVAARRAADAGGGGEPAARVRERLEATRRALDDFLSVGEAVGAPDAAVAAVAI